MKSSEVFVAGGLPTVTYVGREELDLESELRAEVVEGFKIVCVTGPTKSGKTVLCRRTLGNDNCIWISGGQIQDSKDCWEQLIGKIGLTLEETITEKSSVSGGIKALLQWKAKVESGSTYRLTQSMKSEALSYARETGLTLLVDDFHYMPEIVQREFVRAVKNEVFDGLRVVLIAVPHYAFSAINVASEMEGRFAQIEIPKWKIDHLKKIATLGFSELKIEIEDAIVGKLASESFGSPLLMQRFCLRLCFSYEIEETLKTSKNIDPTDAKLNSIFKNVAKHFGLPAYRKLLAGPQSRKDRLQRQLRDSVGKADIYQCILYAIAKTGPRPSIAYNEIRSTLQDLLVESDVPQKNQVTNAISHMVNIAKDKIEGEPVIDWADDVLYLTDPFLMFYMRWVIKPKLSASSPGDWAQLFSKLLDIKIR